MIHRVVLPKFDANITEATVGEWRKSEGEPVEAGEVLVDIITDKANFELTAEVPGVLRKVIAPEKSQVPLGYVVALVGDETDELPDVSAENETLMREYLSSVTGKTVSAPTGRPAPAQGGRPTGEPRGEASGEAPGHPERVRATPRARRLAREHNVDLAALQKALGVEVVTEKDVLKFKNQSTGLK